MSGMNEPEEEALVQLTLEGTMLVLSSVELEDAAKKALLASGTALGHEKPVVFVSLDELFQPASESLPHLVRSVDPWSVVAVDEESIDALRKAFSAEEGIEGFSVDSPALICGYTLVAVPGFESCLDDLAAKRVAWGRLKAARHPKAPC